VPDARKAVELGVDGIVVSNHAGRQVDGTIASLNALEKIVDAVGDKTTVSTLNRASYFKVKADWILRVSDHV
jgi:isopentenyl diphosphate isomerase/L-lactate dehydrogenase-like FMN-dependent dehydrogenase